MTINEHVLIHAKDAGNGYHGNCAHCGIPLVTDLGYSSWAGVKCIDREVTQYNDIPKEIKNYAERWRGLRWIPKRKIYVKPYTDREYTLDEINDMIKNIKQCATI